LGNHLGDPFIRMFVKPSNSFVDIQLKLANSIKYSNSSEFIQINLKKETNG